MSVQSATTRNDYTAGASQTVYAYTFEIKAASDITVIVGGVTKSLNTDYTVSGVGTNSGGNVTLSAAPASGTTVSLVMEMDLARDTDYQANGAFLADDVNNDFDSLWLATNQQETELGRSLRLNQTEPTSDMTLPLKDARKGSVLAFNETTGLPVAGPTIANVDSVAGITGDIATVADNDANITTVAGISGDVTSVANISANVTTVAGNTTNINAVAADASDIGTVASNISNVNTTAGISSDVTTVAGNNVNITTVAGDSSEITTVAGVASDVSIVSGIASDVTAVAGDASDIGTVASSISNVNAVGTNITNVNNVAGNASNINTVAADGTDIGTVAGISANVTTVAGISSDVTTVAGLETKMDTVIADASDIGTVAGISASVTTVANNSSNVTTVAGLETKMDTIIADAADIGAVATNINSVTTVSGISGDVTTVASKASDVETVADNIGDVQAASQNATNAAASAQAAAFSASTAGTHATNASASANQAANSATGADDSEAAAGISASAASSSASAASSSASSAASSASDANDSQAAAALSASGASVSASAAAVSAGNSETAAATWNNFYTTYLGAAASAPSTDLLGQPLQDGALYFNTTDDTMYVFNGSIWIAAESTINIVSVPTQLAADLTTNGNDIIFGDNDKATFGASDDLQIYHNSSNSIITETGTGNLYLGGDNLLLTNGSLSAAYLEAITGGAVNIYHNGATKLTTTATGIDVTGTGSFSSGININSNSVGLLIGGGTTGSTAIGVVKNSAGRLTVDTDGTRSLDLSTGGTKRLSADGSTGDISFYEDTGTTPKLFWDASAESLGIGTSSPSHPLTLQGSGASGNAIKIIGDSTNNSGRILWRNSADSSGTASISVNSSEDMLFGTGGGTERMRIDSSGRVGIGTSSPDTLLEVVGADPILTIRDTETSGASSNATLRLAESGASDTLNNYWDINHTGGSALRFVSKIGATTAERMRIDSTGRVGIGTSSPDKLLDVSSNSAPTIRISNTRNDANWDTDPVFGALEFYSSDASGSGPSVRASVKAEAFTAFGNATDLVFRNGDSQGVQQENLRIDYLGRVGIGTSSPSGAYTQPSLHIHATGNGSELHLTDVTTGATSSDGMSIFQYANDGYIHMRENGSLRTYVNGSERMRIDSSGNLLVGTTDNNVSNNSGVANSGINLLATGQIFAAYGGNTANFNRLGNDGSIINFDKDGTTVGSIGVDYGDRLYIGTGNTGLFFNNTSSTIQPIDTSSNLRDSAIDLGSSGTRFKDLYLSGGVYLGGTGAANKLDDYEEGSFTATLKVGADTKATTTAANYVKVGNLVSITIDFSNQTISAVGASTGNVEITGLPFTAGGQGRQALPAPYSLVDIFATKNLNAILPNISISTTKISLHDVSGTTASGITQNSFTTSDRTGTYFRISGTYQAS